jgi:Ser/Thr protein kinase RdoA (MazF antagonist)
MTTHPATTVQSLIAQHYDLPAPLTVEFLRAYTNDVYHVTAAGDRYVLKMYGAAWRTRSELRYEVDLLHHLHARDVPVALPVAARDGDPVQTHHIGDGERHMMLFTWAPGDKPAPPFLPELYAAEGRAIAAFHAASDDFVSAHARPALDIRYLIDAPLTVINRHLVDPASKRFMTGFASHIAERLHELAAEGLDWGPCHGDATMDNFHVDDDHRIVWYDLDSGGPGWRAGDLQGWAAIVPDATPLWQAFLRGYRDVRPLDPREVEAAPYVSAAFEFWGTAVDLDRRSVRQGAQAVAARLDAAHSVLQRWADRLGFG